MRKIKLTFALLAAIAVIFSAAVPAFAASGANAARSVTRFTTASTWKAEPEECAFLTIINSYRKDKGLAALTISLTLSAAAEDHSIDMAKNNYFSHTLFDGTTWSQNIANHGYPTNTSRGENIAAGRETAAGVFDQWKNSPPHNENMLSPTYKAIGIGRAKQSGSRYTWYWTNTFGSKVDKAYTCPKQTASVSEPSTLAIAAAGRSSSSTSSLLAFDGDTSTSWYTTKTTTPKSAYVYFDLGSAKTISKVSWYFSKGGSADAYTIEVSTDKTNWTVIESRSAAKAGTWQTINVNQQAQYVRFSFKNPNKDAVLGYLAEVKVYP